MKLSSRAQCRVPIHRFPIECLSVLQIPFAWGEWPNRSMKSDVLELLDLVCRPRWIHRKISVEQPRGSV